MVIARKAPQVDQQQLQQPLQHQQQLQKPLQLYLNETRKKPLGRNAKKY